MIVFCIFVASLLANTVRWFETALYVTQDNGTYRVLVTRSELKKRAIYDRVAFSTKAPRNKRLQVEVVVYATLVYFGPMFILFALNIKILFALYASPLFPGTNTALLKAQ